MYSGQEISQNKCHSQRWASLNVYVYIHIFIDLLFQGFPKLDIGRICSLNQPPWADFYKSIKTKYINTWPWTSYNGIKYNGNFCITQNAIIFYACICQSEGSQLVYLPGWRSLAWSQQGFWQPSFCRKRNLWSLCFHQLGPLGRVGIVVE